MEPNAYIGVDVGGTKIAAARIAVSGKILERTTVPTETNRGKAAILKNIVAAIDGVRQGKEKGIGIGMAGMVDWKKDVFVSGPNFPDSFRNVRVAETLRKKYRATVEADNDVHCFTLGEARYGAGKGKHVVVGMTLGTGVGGAIIHEGNVFRGAHNGAGEIGHTVVSMNGSETCGCGNVGHLESYASGTGLRSLYRTLAGKDADAIEIENLANAGDADALAVFATMRKGLATGIANVLHSFDPDIVVIGGGLAKAAALWNPAIAEARSLVAFPALRKTPIVRSKLGGDANLLGAATLVHNRSKR